MSKYDITVSLTPICPSCGKDLAIGFTLSKPTERPLERDDPLSRVDRRVFVHSCPVCFVFKPHADEVANDLLKALEAILPMLSDWHDEFPDHVGDKEGPAIKAASAAIAKAKGEQQ